MLLTLKTAGLLAFLHGDDITIHWWNMAVQVVEVSRNVRNHVRDLALVELQSAYGDKANAEVSVRTAIDEATRVTYLDSMIGSMTNYIRNNGNGKPVNRSQLANACAGKHKHLVPPDDAITEALQRGLLVKVGQQYDLPIRN
jgi:hypothetical protein